MPRTGQITQHVTWSKQSMAPRLSSYDLNAKDRKFISSASPMSPTAQQTTHDLGAQDNNSDFFSS